MAWPKGKPRSPESRAKIAAAQIGKTHSDETKAKIGAASRGRTASEETRQRMQEARLAFLGTLTDEERRAASASYGMQGKSHSAQTREKMATSARMNLATNPRPPERAAEQSARMKARFASMSEDDRLAFAEKCRQAQTGRSHTAATKEKIGAGHARYWASLPADERLRRVNQLRSTLVDAWQAVANIHENTSIEQTVARRLTAQGTVFVSQKLLGPFVVDFFIPSTRQVIEVNGCYWHSCPQCGLQGPTGATERDARKAHWLENHGYNVLVIWEHELR